MRVAFVSLAAHPVLDPAVAGGIGGAEVRAVTLARALAHRGPYEVHFVVQGAAGPGVAQQGDLSIHFAPPAHSRRRSDKGGWWQHPWELTRRAFASLDARLTGRPRVHEFYESLPADVVCCFGVRNDTARIVRSVKHQGRRAIVFLTSDRTLTDIRRTGRRCRGAYGEIGSCCRYALQMADAVIVQTETQQHALRDRLGLNSFLIRNPIDLRLQMGDPTQSEAQPPSQPFALWVGRGDTFSKRADVCLELARRCPHILFLLIMNRQDALVYDQLVAHAPGNVTVVERVPFAQIEAYYRRAVALVNTSEVEGFPNSFLQAGKYGVPILSLWVDPDGMLGHHNCGWSFEGNLSAMAEQLEDVWRDVPEVNRKRSAIRHYVQQRHDLSQRVTELEQVLHCVARRRAAA